MFEWLQQDLASTNQKWIIAYWHHPPYTKGTHDSDDLIDSSGRMAHMRETFLPILEAGGVDLVLTGHSHNYERSHLIDGAYGYGNGPIHQTPDTISLTIDSHIIDGTGGSYTKSETNKAHTGTVYTVIGHSGDNNLGGEANPHPTTYYRDILDAGSGILTISGNTLTLENLHVSGMVTDVFTITK